MADKIVLRFVDDSINELRTRSERMTRSRAPFRLAGTALSVQFLRGVFSRASLCIPAYYYFLGSAAGHDEAIESSDYPFRIAQSYSEFSDLNTLTLSCRKIFDHSRKPDLTGGNFSKVPDCILEDHAKYWAKNSLCSSDEALAALRFLRLFFRECSRSDTQLLQSKGILQKRIGLLKQHADRAAAHLSLEDYSLDIMDLTHFTAACAVVGEIVRSFDMPHLSPSYFNDIDSASYQAAKRVFPQITKFQLFKNWKMETQARLYWQCEDDQGVQMLLNQIHCAVGGDPEEEA